MVIERRTKDGKVDGEINERITSAIKTCQSLNRALINKKKIS